MINLERYVGNGKIRMSECVIHEQYSQIHEYIFIELSINTVLEIIICNTFKGRILNLNVIFFIYFNLFISC